MEAMSRTSGEVLLVKDFNSIIGGGLGVSNDPVTRKLGGAQSPKQWSVND